MTFEMDDLKRTNAMQEQACEILCHGTGDALISTLSDEQISACIRLSSLVKKKGFSVVITPKRAYAKNEVKYLTTKNISAYYWNGCSSYKTINVIKKQLIKADSKLKILYLTYQQVINPHVQFKLMQSTSNLTSFIIHETYSLSPQTSDFVKLCILKKNFPKIPIIAFISSATETIIEDIKIILRLKNPKILDNKFVKKELNKDVIAGSTVLNNKFVKKELNEDAIAESIVLNNKFVKKELNEDAIAESIVLNNKFVKKELNEVISESDSEESVVLINNEWTPQICEHSKKQKIKLFKINRLTGGHSFHEEECTACDLLKKNAEVLKSAEVLKKLKNILYQ